MNKKQKQKVLLMTGIYPRFKGGAEYQMRLIADLLKDEYEIVFVYLGDVPGETVQRTYSEVIEGYKVYFIQTCEKWDELFLKYRYSKQIYKVLQAERPDFVYQRVLKFASYYISKFQKELGFKHFIHIADLFTLEFKNRSLRDRFNYYFFKKTVTNGPQFVVQTHEQLLLLKKYGVTPRLQIYNMHPSSEDIDISSIAESKINQKVRTIVWVANIKPIKQLEVFIDLAESYSERVDFQFTIVGDIQDQVYAQSLVDRIESLPNLKHYSGKDNSFVNRYIMEEASLVVNTSKSEGFSNVFIQSWLRGVPILSLNSNPDGLFDKHPALGANCDNNTAALKSKVIELLVNDTYVSRAKYSYDVAMELFTFNNIERLKQLFKK